MKDYKFYNVCDHKVFQILEIEGISPNFTSNLDYISNKNIDLTLICEVNGISNINLIAMNGVGGITNYIYSEDGKVLHFGIYPVTPEEQFPDNNLEIIPPNTYFCSYVASLNDCPKCLGSKYAFDILFEESGRVKRLEGHDKVRQQVIKALLTLKGDNLFNDQYGSLLSSFIGLRIDEYLAAQLNFTILQAINELVSIQSTQGLPDNERIVSISDITVAQDTTDPRILNITVILMLADYEQISTTLSLKV